MHYFLLPPVFQRISYHNMWHLRGQGATNSDLFISGYIMWNLHILEPYTSLYPIHIQCIKCNIKTYYLFPNFTVMFFYLFIINSKCLFYLKQKFQWWLKCQNKQTKKAHFLSSLTYNIVSHILLFIFSLSITWQDSQKFLMRRIKNTKFLLHITASRPVPKILLIWS